MMWSPQIRMDQHPTPALSDSLSSTESNSRLLLASTATIQQVQASKGLLLVLTSYIVQSTMPIDCWAQKVL